MPITARRKDHGTASSQPTSGAFPTLPHRERQGRPTAGRCALTIRSQLNWKIRQKDTAPSETVHDVDRAAQADEREELGELSGAGIHPEGFVSYGQPREHKHPGIPAPCGAP